MPTRENSTRWLDAIHALRNRFASGLEPDVATVLAQPGEKRVLVACSGGADSVCLLCLLAALAEEHQLRLTVAHYNHRWRGEAADEDAHFVRALAANLNCFYFEGTRSNAEAAFTETAARELRLGFLRQTAAAEDCAYIAFGHQADDILETQLQRLARGSGTVGLSAPRPVHRFEGNPTHLRPLLHLRAGDIRMALNAAGISWREDQSNQDTSIARNALRRLVIPALVEAVDRSAVAGAARSRALLEEDAAALELLAREHLPQAYDASERLPLECLRTKPKAPTRRALSHWLHNDQGSRTISAPLLSDLLDAIYAGGKSARFSTAEGFIVIAEDALFFESEGATFEPTPLVTCSLKSGESVLLSNGDQLSTEWVDLDELVRATIFSGAVDAASEAFVVLAEDANLDIRSRRPGDRFYPLGAPGSRKLQDCFIDHHVPIRERERLPIVCSEEGTILWVPGFPPAESHKLSPASIRALRLTYCRASPP